MPRFGVMMAFNAILTYGTMVPQSPLFLVIYLPAVAILVVLGAYWLLLAEKRYRAESEIQRSVGG
jgi:hypothetical protein